MKEIIYFDNAATTPIRPEVYEEMKPYIETYFGNASSVYGIARESKKAIDKAREQVAKALSIICRADTMTRRITGLSMRIVMRVRGKDFLA